MRPFCILILAATLHGSEKESDFSKKELFSLFGYAPLMSGEEKELRTLHSTAEGHMKKKEFLPAEKLYEEILSRIDPPYLSTNRYKVDWATYIDLVLRLSDVKLALKEYSEGEKLLGNLIETHPPSDYIPSLNFHLARFFAAQNNPGKAWLKMQEAGPLFPIEKWKGEDRSFYHGLEYLLNDYFENLLQKAGRFSASGMVKEAISLYEEISKAIEQGYYPKASEKDSIDAKKVRYRLSSLYFQEAKYEKMLSLVSETEKNKDALDCEMIYLSANCFKEKREYQRAIELFETYASEKNSRVEKHLEHAFFEIGLSKYHTGDIEKSASYFEKSRHCSGKIGLLSSIYLSKIALKEKDHEKAHKILSTLASKISRDDPLKFEVFYLRAEVAFMKGDYSHAIELYESSIPTSLGSCEWTPIATYNLGLCYLKLSEESKKNEKALLLKSEAIFDSLLKSSPSESIILMLANLYLEQQKFEKVQQLLANYESSFSRDGKLAALLLLAESKKEYEEREKIYSQGCEEHFQNSPLYPECFFKRGLNDFHASHYNEALNWFEKAFSLYEKKNPEMATHVQEWQACTHFYQKLPLDALLKLEKLAQSSELKNLQEILYLQGLLATHLAENASTLKESEEYQKKGVETLKDLANGTTPWKMSAALALGCHYFRKKEYEEAQKIFSEIETHEDSLVCSASYFWHAECMQRLHANPEQVLTLRKKCYEKFPSSTLAPLAYFKCYSIEKYHQGDPSAIAHLKSFPTLFPHSPLLTAVYYFIGMHEEERSASTAAFEGAIAAFEKNFEKATENKMALKYFYTRSLFEFSRRVLNYEPTFGQVTHLTSLLEKCVKEWEPQDNFGQKLKDESRYLLAKCYLQSDQEVRGSKILMEILEENHALGVKEGPLLACVLMEQGKIAMNHDDLKAAELCFQMASECGEKHLQSEERLMLWLSESQCFKRENKLDLAMRMLSNVINEDVKSPLRDQAMFLRAEIYELEGRHELAIRQLESSSKRGGIWGQRAKEKLKVEYGL